MQRGEESRCSNQKRDLDRNKDVIREMPERPPRETGNHKWALRHKVDTNKTVRGLTYYVAGHPA